MKQSTRCQVTFFGVLDRGGNNERSQDNRPTSWGTSDQPHSSCQIDKEEHESICGNSNVQAARRIRPWVGEQSLTTALEFKTNIVKKMCVGLLENDQSTNSAGNAVEEWPGKFDEIFKTCRESFYQKTERTERRNMEGGGQRDRFPDQIQLPRTLWLPL